jgi:hypothetical protein
MWIFAWDGFLSQGISGILQRNHQPLLFSLSFSPSCSKYFKTRNSWDMQHPLSLEHLQRCFVCDLCKNISRIQVLVIKFFTTPPPHQIKTRTVNRWETTNNKPPGPFKLPNPIRNKEQSINSIWLYSLHSCRAKPWAIVGIQVLHEVGVGLNTVWVNGNVWGKNWEWGCSGNEDLTQGRAQV